MSQKFRGITLFLLFLSPSFFHGLQHVLSQLVPGKVTTKIGQKAISVPWFKNSAENQEVFQLFNMLLLVDFESYFPKFWEGLVCVFLQMKVKRGLA